MTNLLPISKDNINKFAKGFDNEKIKTVSLEISPVDHMYEPDKEGAELHYFKIGVEAISIIEKTLNSCKNEPTSILDFGCGYGRVLRFLVNQFPKAEIVACELENKYINYCGETFDVKTFQSSPDIGTLPTNRQYDLIWAGSVFTHLSKNNFGELFEYFKNNLNSG